MQVSKAEFSRMIGVSKAAIQKAERRGLVRLVEKNGKRLIDTDDETNALYAARHYGAKEGVQEADAEQPEPQPATSNNDPRQDVPPPKDTQDLPLAVQESLALIRQRNASADKAEQQRLKELGVLIHEDIVKALIASIGGQVQARILTLPDRIEPRVKALAESGDFDSLKKLLAEEAEDIAQALQGAVKEVDVEGE